MQTRWGSWPTCMLSLETWRRRGASTVRLRTAGLGLGREGVPGAKLDLVAAGCLSAEHGCGWLLHLAKQLNLWEAAALDLYQAGLPAGRLNGEGGLCHACCRCFNFKFVCVPEPERCPQLLCEPERGSQSYTHRRSDCAPTADRCLEAIANEAPPQPLSSTWDAC